MLPAFYSDVFDELTILDGFSEIHQNINNEYIKTNRQHSHSVSVGKYTFDKVMVHNHPSNKSESVLRISSQSPFDHQSTTDQEKRKMNTPEALTNTYKLFTVNRLRSELRRKGLKTSGKKSALIYRLVNKMTSNANGDTLKRRIVAPEETTQLNGSECQHELSELKNKLRKERENLVLWKRPFTTLNFFIKELTIVTYTFLTRLLAYKKLVSLTLLVIVFILISTKVTGPHQLFLKQLYKDGRWCLYWLGLGVLSSVGLGTGLHTFLLYLGPHIASVTLAAYECGSLNFPEPPYPDQIICPEEGTSMWATSLWNIMQKVKIESVMWGAGTALGELPPYFMARAARLSGYDPDDEDDLKEFEDLQKKSEQDPSSMTLVEMAKVFMEKIVKRVGFLGILACASIPNPLFDLAGITCGHFLIPFWTFFGATLLGKAVIKMMIQVLFVIIAFNEVLIETALAYVSYIPVVGVHLQPPLIQFLENQKQRLHSKGGTVSTAPNKLSTIFDLLVLTMVGYFVLSIINSMAQSYHKRINKEQVKKKTKRNSSK